MVTPVSRVRSHFLLLHNPAAGRNGEQLVQKVAGALRQRGAAVDVSIVTAAPDPIAGASQQYDAVVISGGDGSIRAMAERLSSETVPLGIIPNGTGNVLAHELDFPRSPSELAAILLEGRTVPVNGGTVNGVPFLLMFGAGFDGSVVAQLSRPMVQRFGKLAYALPILRTIARAPTSFDVLLDGRHFVTSWLLITNASRYAGRFRLTSRTRLGDSSLVAFLSHAKSRRERLAELLNLIRGHFDAASTIKVLPFSRGEILNPDVPSQIDGEPIPPGPYVLELRHDASMIIAPVAAGPPAALKP